MLPTQGKRTPYELFHGKKPEVSGLRVFGAPCYATLVNGKKRDKLGERSVAGRLVGYSSVSKGYLVWVPEFRQVIETRDCVFYEEYDHDPVSGQVAYDGSPRIDDSSPTVNGEESPSENHALPPLLPQAPVAHTGTHMVLRTRPSGVQSAPRVVNLGGAKSQITPIPKPPPSSMDLSEVPQTGVFLGYGGDH